MRLRTLLASTIAFVASSGAAFATLPAAGTYTGTSQDGQAVSFTVSTDGNGKLAVTSVNASIDATCHHNEGSFSSSAGYGADVVIPAASGKVYFTQYYAFLYQKVTGTFSGGTFAGTIYSIVPTLYSAKAGMAPRAATVCIAATQPFTATLGTQSAAAFAKAAAGVKLYSIHK